MKLALKLDSPEGTAFYPQNRVEAVLRIRGVAQKPARIRAILKGTLKLWAPAQAFGDSTEWAHILFECHREIEPTDLIREEDETKQLIYSSKVAFQLPAKTRCCERCGSCPLPPSLDVTDSGINIKSEYSISVTVDRCIIGPVTKSTRAKQTLPFICDPPVILPPSIPRAPVIPVPLQKLRQEDHATVFGDGNTSLPPYSSFSASLQVEVLLPQPPVLIPGRPTPIALVINAPPELLRTRDIYIRSMAARLHTTVTTGKGSSSWSVTVARQVCDLAGRIRIDQERFQLDSGAWGSFLVHNSRPTFKSCLLQISDTAEVTIGVSQGLGDDIHHGLAYGGVIVMDSPPSYEDNLNPMSDSG